MAGPMDIVRLKSQVLSEILSRDYFLKTCIDYVYIHHFHSAFILV